MIALGNQTDLTHGDLLAWFARAAGDRDHRHLHRGLQGPRRARFRQGRAPRRRQRQAVVVYKAGRTAPGIGGVMGHTASVAGDARAVRFGRAPRRRDRRRRFQRVRRSVLHRRRAAQEDHRRQSPRRDQRRGLRGGRHRRFDRDGDLRDGDGRTGTGHRQAPGRDPRRQAAGRAGGGEKPHRHQSGRRRRGPSADHRGLPAGPEHRRRRGRTRPDRAGRYARSKRASCGPDSISAIRRAACT